MQPSITNKPSLKWKVKPYGVQTRTRWMGMVWLILAILWGFNFSTYYSFLSGLFFGLFAVLFIESVFTPFMAVSYEMDAEKAGARWGFFQANRLRWEMVKKIEVQEDRILLSLMKKKSMFSSWFTIEFLFNENKDEVIEFVKKYAPEDAFASSNKK